MRTRTGCCVSTSRNEPRSPTSNKPTSTTSRQNSTTDLDKPSDGDHHHKHSTKCCVEPLNSQPNWRARITSAERTPFVSRGRLLTVWGAPGCGPVTGASQQRAPNLPSGQSGRMPPVSEFTTSDGVAISFACVGTGPPLYLCHGGPIGDRHGLVAQVAALAGRHMLVSHDYRGSGASS